MDRPIEARVRRDNITPGGYRMISVNGEKLMEHRYVMAQKLGRPLHRDETVHHRNGVRSDNTLENLELWTSRHPKGQRVEDQVCWAREILELYGGLF